MKLARSGGIKGHVMVTAINEEANEEVKVFREGRLGLTFRFPTGRLKQPIGRPVAVKPRSGFDADPQSQGGRA